MGLSRNQLDFDPRSGLAIRNIAMELQHKVSLEIPGYWRQAFTEIEDAIRTGAPNTSQVALAISHVDTLLAMRRKIEAIRTERADSESRPLGVDLGVLNVALLRIRDFLTAGKAKDKATAFTFTRIAMAKVDNIYLWSTSGALDTASKQATR